MNVVASGGDGGFGMLGSAINGGANPRDGGGGSGGFVIKGGASGLSLVSGGDIVSTSDSGISFWGGGPRTIFSGQGFNANATAYGTSGTGGAVSGVATDFAGGDGASGVILVQEYF